MSSGFVIINCGVNGRALQQWTPLFHCWRLIPEWNNIRLPYYVVMTRDGQVVVSDGVG